MKTSFVTASVLALSLGAFSALADNSQNSQAPAEPDITTACPNLNLTQTQQDQIKQLKDNVKTDMTAQQQALKQAKDDYRTALADPNVSKVNIQAMETALKQQINKSIDTAFSAADSAIFDIFRADQRAEGVACIEKMRKDANEAKKQKECAQIITPVQQRGTNQSISGVDSGVALF